MPLRPVRIGAVLVILLALDMTLSAAYVAASFGIVDGRDGGQPIAVLWGNENEIGAETVRRIAYAVDAWKSGAPSRQIFCIGGARPVRGYFGAQVTSRLLVAAGIPADRIRAGSGSNDTISNLSEIAEVARSENVHEVLVVSDRLQAMRAILFLPQPIGVRLIWLPYDYRSALPAIGLFELWRTIHYEWIAVASMLLPKQLRRDIINSFRR